MCAQDQRTNAQRVRRYVPGALLGRKTRAGWVAAVAECYAACAPLDTTAARRALLRALAALPRALCAHFPAAPVATSDAAVDLASGHGRLTLGVNRTGLHVFDAAACAHVHSVPYREIRQVASGPRVRSRSTLSELQVQSV